MAIFSIVAELHHTRMKPLAIFYFGVVLDLVLQPRGCGGAPVNHDKVFNDINRSDLAT